MTFSNLLILAAASIAMQLALFAFSRSKMHMIIFVFAGVIPGIIFILLHFFFYQEWSIRPFLKSLITSSVFSIIALLSVEAVKRFKKNFMPNEAKHNT